MTAKNVAPRKDEKPKLLKKKASTSTKNANQNFITNPDSSPDAQILKPDTYTSFIDSTTSSDNSSSQSSTTVSTEVFHSHITSTCNTISMFTEEMTRLKLKIETLEKKQKPEEEYFKKSNVLMTTILMIHVILPFIVVITTILCLLHLLPDSQFTYFTYGFISIIGLGSFIEMIYVPYKLYVMDQRINKLENNTSNN